MKLKQLFIVGIFFGVVLLGRSEVNTADTNNYVTPWVASVRPGNLASSDWIQTNVNIQLNQYIWIDVRGDLDKWLGSTNDRASLVPCFNGVELAGIHPLNPNVSADTNMFVGNTYHFRFYLNRQDDASRAAWKSLLNHPVYKKSLVVTLAKASGEQMDTNINKNKIDDYCITPSFLVVIPVCTGVISLLIICVSLVLFFVLARRTDILKDTTSVKRPDDQPCYSLGRTQMAFWFFLVLTSFLLLWLVTGDVDTITASVLGLIGISAGTALGSAVIDAAKTGDSDISKHVIRSDLLGKSRKDIVTALNVDREQLTNSLVTLQTEHNKLLQSALSQPTSVNQAVVDANTERQRDVRDKLANINWQINFYSMKPWKVVMYDLLGDKEIISFHRFQIFVWTIVLGFIFVSQVDSDLTMPEFSGQLLALMGISAGTFIGFKLPDQKSAASS